MKILIIQEYSRHPENIKYRECLCFERAFKHLGHDAYSWGLGHPNYSTVPEFNKYDLILCCENYGDGWLPDLTNINKPYKIFYAIDPHVRGIEPYEMIFKNKGYDTLCIAVRDFCTKSHHFWLPPAVDDSLFYDMNIQRDVPIGFVGHVATFERGQLLNTAKSILGLSIHIGVFGDGMVSLLNRFKISFNKNISNDTNYRNFESIACGCILLVDNNPALFDLGFKHNENCLIYNDIQDIPNLFPVKKANTDTLCLNARELAKRHTYLERCKNILEIL